VAALVRAELAVIAWAVVLLPVALAPTLVWGLTNRIEPSTYPASWARMQPALDQVGGDVIVLPWEQYSLPGFTGNRTVEQPASGYFGEHVVVSADAKVRGLRGDTGRRAQVSAALRAARADARAGRDVHLGRDLDRLGFAGVLVIGNEGGEPLAGDATLRRVRADDDIALWVVDHTD
jgi:hypothetical protein